MNSIDIDALQEKRLDNHLENSDKRSIENERYIDETLRKVTEIISDEIIVLEALVDFGYLTQDEILTYIKHRR